MTTEQCSGLALSWLDADASARREAGLHREVTPREESGALVDLASNDYLGLARHPATIAGAQEAAARWGTGATASRLVAGTTRLHDDFERDLAAFLGVEAALVFSSGYLANIGAVSALAGRDGFIVSDTGAHASLIDGCRLSRSQVVVIERGDHEALARVLATRTRQRALVVTDSVYSIDGVIAPIAEYHQVAREHGAMLLVDEAHALGVRGRGGRGVVDELGLSGADDLVVTTVLSKSLGSQGGVVAGSARVRDHLVDTARTFIFDTGLNPPAAGAARAALATLRDNPDLCDQVRHNAARIAERCGGQPPESAVVSLIVGDPHRAVEAAAGCRGVGVHVGCFRPPSVPAGTSRLRLTARADLSEDLIDDVTSRIRGVLDGLGVRVGA
ncbi:8-amino-7-oxononanoate synthase [Gordonia jinhuaensis]|uniref:8-amino-7-oxononanoate synthase n=1 Tax=Gordonia jinhuaensis TaxID=1517702 RepID=UPI00166D7E42|nr:8-amino-7-oxononanoate synthase [Gordonia jinhuaensis]